jgi:hypothetical protein
MKMSGTIAGKADMFRYVSRVFEIEAVLSSAVWVYRERVDVRAVKRVSPKELIAGSLDRRLRQPDRSSGSH